MTGGWLLLAVTAAAAVLAVLGRRFTEIRDAPPPAWSPPAPPPQVGAAPEPVEVTGWRQGEGEPAGSLPAQPNEGGRVPVTHPMIRQAAESAMARGGALARSFVREGAMIYATFEGIPDPAEREAALDILMRVQSGEEVEMEEAVWLIRRLTGRE
jgi:hypothetical protein